MARVKAATKKLTTTGELWQQDEGKINMNTERREK